MTAQEIDLAFLIADLSGYTALTEAHGNVEAARAVTRYREIALEVMGEGARLLDSVGDELLIAADSGPAAVRTAVRLRAAVESEPRFPAIRCGINRGRVVESGGRYYGAALNLTARVAAHARGGQILCTTSIADVASSVDGVRLVPIGSVSFKNILDPVALFEVFSAAGAGEGATVDPVCRMQVSPANAPARLPFDGRTYFFCSFDCARAFAERPQSYASS
jgi:class 3 adenylate cyclase